MKDPQEALSFLNEGTRYLVSTHVNPDGDGVGSALGVKWLLEKMGKEAAIVIASPPPASLDFLPRYEQVTEFGSPDAPLAPFDRVVIVDAPYIKRLGEAASLVAEGASVLIIDHHPTDEVSEAARFIDETSSSTAELVFRLITASGHPLDREVAWYLYTGLLIDTGRFRFSNTLPETLRVAAALLEAGASPDGISERLFYHNSYETTRALGTMIESLELHLGGRVATATFDLAFVSSPEWKKVDTEGFVNHALAVIGVEVAVLLREIKEGVTRLSLRAKNDFNVNLLANEFGGGGHAKAAGCTIEEPLAGAKAKILDAIAIRLKSAG